MPRSKYTANDNSEDSNNAAATIDGGGGVVEQMEVETNAAAGAENNAADKLAADAMETESTTTGGGVGEEEDEGSARSEATFRFTVEGISRLREQVLSQATMVRNLPWRIMVMPRQDQQQQQQQQTGPNNALRNMSLGFFLQCNGDSDSSSWNCSAVATLKILPQKNLPTAEPFSRKISHIFHSKENDWGYSNFVDWAALTDPSKGFIKSDSILLEVDVKADAPHGVAWDSKKLTGFVGLKNQGATCYMNSLLQTLFFTNQLRKAVYKMPTESDDSTKSVALALQRVFYELQTCDKPVGTKKLTRSFGWETLDSFMQHDVQEFLRVLLDKLESKMKATCVEGTVPKLFEGKMISFIKCRHVTYESSRSETYYDIQLNIKGKKDIYESFRDYVATELLDGDNKYDAGNHGLQEAEKGVIFTSFPPVLHLHLMRFQYDPVTDCSVKSNDRFEFHEKIDLSEFLKKDAQVNAEKESAYTLHAVLVHSGDNHGGHYVVFINPKGDGRWCKFDDDVVSRCSKTEAIQHNFGGQEMDDLHPGVKQSTNAYMLVYIRDADLSNVLQEVTEDDIPRELLERLKDEKNLEILKRKERSEAHLFMNVTLMVEDAFAGHMGVDLYDSEKSTPAVQANSRIFKVPKRIKPKEFIDNIAEAFNVPPPRLRLWPFSFRTNKSIRPIYLDMSPETSKSLEESQYGVTLPIFLEMLPASSEEERLRDFDKENDVILFIKMYDPLNDGGSLHYMGHICVSITTTFNDIARECKRRSQWSEDTPVTLYEEVGSANVEKVVDMGATLDQGLDELMDGDIIVYHRTIDFHLHNNRYLATGANKIKSLQEFYTHMQFRHEVTFVDKQTPVENFTTELSLKCSYFEMAEMVGQRLGVHPKFIQFFKSQPYKDIPGYPIKYEPEAELMAVLNVLNKPMRSPFKLFYYVLGIPVTELEHKKQFKVAFYTPEEQEREMIIYVNKSPRILIRDILSELLRVVNLERSAKVGAAAAGQIQRMRMVEISQHRVVSIVDDDTGADIIIQNNTVNRYYRAEEIPNDEITLDDKLGETLVGVAHFHKEARATFGVPFIIKVTPGEKWSSLRTRLQSRAQMSEKEWSKIRIALVTSGTAKFVVDDDETMSNPSPPPPSQTAAPPLQSIQYSSTISIGSVIQRDQFLPPTSSSYTSSSSPPTHHHSNSPLLSAASSQFLSSRPWLGIEHVNKAPKRSRYSTLEKAIKIYN